MKINNRLRLYLDDIRTPVDDDWIVVRNYDEFVAQIKLHNLGNFEAIGWHHHLQATHFQDLEQVLNLLQKGVY